MSDPSDIIGHIGCRFNATFVYEDELTNLPINISGYAARFAIRRSFETAVVLQLAVGSGLTISGAAGEIDVDFTSDQTVDLSGAYVYTLTVTPPGSDQEHLVTGTITFFPIA